MSDTVCPLVADLESHIGYWLRLVSNHVSGGFARALQLRQVSVAEWVALRQLYDRTDVTPGELAERMGMTRGAITKVLDKLERKGWIVRRPSPHDSRSQMVTLTPEGENAVPVLAEIADTNDAANFDCLTVEERDILTALLRKLATAHDWHDVPVE